MPKKGQVVGQSTVTPDGGRQYARRRFPLHPVCAECEVAPSRVRHHWDGNPTNNVANVVGLCYRCHSRIHGPLDPSIARVMIQRRATSKAAHTHCKHGHEYTPENTYLTKEGRICRVCAAENQRRYQKRKNR